MHDFRCADPDKMHYGEMADRTRYLKENPKGVSQMCKILEDMRDETRKDTQKETSIDIAIKMLEDHEPEAKVQKYTGLSPADIQNIKEGKPVMA